MTDRPEWASRGAVKKRLLSFRRIEGGHWIFTGSKASGYGQMWVDGRLLRAPRIAWMIWRGEIPEGCEVHHKFECARKDCFNPRHLEIHTGAQHRRLHLQREFCKRNHDMSKTAYVRPNGKRYCRACHAIVERERRARIREAA